MASAKSSSNWGKTHSRCVKAVLTPTAGLAAAGQQRRWQDQRLGDGISRCNSSSNGGDGTNGCEAWHAAQVTGLSGQHDSGRTRGGVMSARPAAATGAAVEEMRRVTAVLGVRCK